MPQVAFRRGAAFAAGLAGLMGPLAPHAQEPAWAPLEISGAAPPLGVFDPAPAADPAGGFVMAYSGVAPSATHPDQNERVVTIHLARSADGRRWAQVATPFPAIDVPAGDEALTWNTEVASLAADTNAAPAQTWRLAVHRFPLIDGERRFEYGWIALFEAETAEQLGSADEIKLLVGRGYEADETRAFPSDAEPVLRGREMHEDLAWCAAFTEPALLARGGALYLAATCAEFSFISGVTPKIVLFRCGAPCMPTRSGAWAYLGDLLGDEAAERDDVDAYTAAAWVAHEGRDYLIATPLGDEPFGGAYKGCRVFAALGLDQARLSRRSALLVPPQSGVFEGACAGSSAAGLLLSSRLELTRQGPRFHILEATEPSGLWRAMSELNGE